MKTDKSVEDKIRAVVSRESSKCIGKDSGELSNARVRLKRMYLGYGYDVDDDRAERGLSTYVDRTVMESVEWAKPGLFRVFASQDEIIRFEPKSEQEEQAAADATVYVNQVVFGRNMFSLIHDVLTDGLYQRVGWCLAHTPKTERRTVDKYEGLLEQEAQALIAQANPESPDDIEAEQYVDPILGQPMYNLSIHRTVTEHEIKVEPIPSEQVIISTDAKDVETARFVAYWTLKTGSDLRKEGYSQDLINSLPANETDDMPEARVTHEVNAESNYDRHNDTGALREYKVFEAWTDVDIDGDGVAEKIKVVYCGDAESLVIMKWEEWPLYRAPLFAASSVPIPHSAIGLCVADLVSDLQTLKTEITRQYLDGLAMGNQGELAVIDRGMTADIDYDSLLARGVGSVHRFKGDVQVMPLPITSNASEALGGLEMAGQIVERRTGISSRTQSIKADTLQNTATGASIMEEAINQRLELVARVYAEGFFKPLGRYILHLLQKYQNKAVQVRVKGKFMQFDPRKWDPDMDISVAVGLGTGNRSKMLAAYQGILQIQQAFLMKLGKLSPVKLKHIVYTCHKMVEAAGLEAPERFFGTEEDAQRAEQAMAQQPPQPSPEQQKVQLEQQKAMAKMQTETFKAQSDAQRKNFETQAKIQLEQQKQQNQMAMKAVELQGEKEMDMYRIRQGDRGVAVQNLRQPL